ncbi:MAG: sterol desaturase family protein [Phaeodactylibacter sp.]|uniref:sterol desaturase family protein n=1 Tax=Phaeodactylibacter sp. TaxID=1940289 RepID=UPI0032EB9906
MENIISHLPTPLEIILDPISLIVLSMYAALMIWESLVPGRKLPNVRHWKLKGIISFIVFFFVSSYLPIWIDPFISQYLLFDLSGWGTFGGMLIGILGYQLVFYIYHRSVHRFDLLWRTFHQMHHSAERLDTYGAFFFSPAEMISFTFLGSFVFAFLIGLSPQAVTGVILLLNFFTIFQHANIRTPRWLGYIIQRPESHTIHHRVFGLLTI